MRMKSVKHGISNLVSSGSGAHGHSHSRRSVGAGRVQRSAFTALAALTFVCTIVLLLFMFVRRPISASIPMEQPVHAETHQPVTSSAGPWPLPSSSAGAVSVASFYESLLVVLVCDDASETAFNFAALPATSPGALAVYTNCAAPRRPPRSNVTLLIDPNPWQGLDSFRHATEFLSRAVQAGRHLQRTHLLFFSNDVSSFYPSFRRDVDDLILELLRHGAVAPVCAQIVDGDTTIIAGLQLVETTATGQQAGTTLALLRRGLPVRRPASSHPPLEKGATTPFRSHSLASIDSLERVSQHLAVLAGSAGSDEVIACRSFMLTLVLASMPLQVSDPPVILSSVFFPLREKCVLRQALLPLLSWVASDFYAEAPQEVGAEAGRKLRELVLRVLPSGAAPIQEALRDVVLHWDPYCGCTGINIEAVNFIVSLEKAMMVRAVASPDCWCRGFHAGDVEALRRAQQPKLLGGKKTIWVSHKPVDAFPSFPYSGAIDFGPDRPSYVIGRTMIETDRISPAWVRALSHHPAVDELWVPSSFLVEAFYKSGVPASLPIFVVPEAIDVETFDSSRFSAEQRQTKRTELLREAAIVPPSPRQGDRQGDGGQQRPGNEAALVLEALSAMARSHFIFLSNFKWEPRKGWDVLLRAYFNTFTLQDPVVLLIKTYLYLDPFPRDVARLQERVRRFAQSNGYRMESLPRIGFLVAESDMSEMPAMYNAADAFVLATRGEGWGLPLQEAMAMGIPTIGTGWGGNVDFMNESNSYLIQVTGMVSEHTLQSQIGKSFSLLPLRRSGTKDNGLLNRMPMFAEPSAKHLGEIMRYVVANSGGEEVAVRAKRGAALMRERFSREAVRDVVLARLQKITKEKLG
jgi:glycosyltransferase involved in cell wall biosynthesis